MAKSHLTPKLIICFLISLSLASCNSSVDSENEIAHQTEDISDSSDIELIEEPEEQGSPFDILSGNEFFTQKQIDVTINNSDHSIDIACIIDLAELAEYPKALVEQFGEHETANHLQVTVVGKDSTGKELFSDKRGNFTGGPRNFNFSFPLKDYQSLKTGMQKITLSFEAEYVSFRNDGSGVKPIVCDVSFYHYMPPVYETIFYFKSLKLNEEKVQSKLGDNDHSNADPETGIQVLWNNTSFLYEHAENSFELNKKTSAKIYHTNPSDFVTIRIVDADYGFNPNDFIEVITLSLANLQTETYQNYPSEYVEELWIYCVPKGQVN